MGKVIEKYEAICRILDEIMLDIDAIRVLLSEDDNAPRSWEEKLQRSKECTEATVQTHY